MPRRPSCEVVQSGRMFHVEHRIAARRTEGECRTEGPAGPRAVWPSNRSQCCVGECRTEGPAVPRGPPDRRVHAGPRGPPDRRGACRPKWARRTEGACRTGNQPDRRARGAEALAGRRARSGPGRPIGPGRQPVGAPVGTSRRPRPPAVSHSAPSVGRCRRATGTPARPPPVSRWAPPRGRCRRTGVTPAGRRSRQGRAHARGPLRIALPAGNHPAGRRRGRPAQPAASGRRRIAPERNGAPRGTLIGARPPLARSRRPSPCTSRSKSVRHRPRTGRTRGRRAARGGAPGGLV